MGIATVVSIVYGIIRKKVTINEKKFLKNIKKYFLKVFQFF
jgi:hypothetical protein